MSGHSKWHRIKRKKAAVDNKRGQEFTRLAKQISTAARENPNPEQNAALRDAIERAKEANMPQDKIDNVLKKRSDSPSQSVVYEGFGANGVAVLMMANTDNSNRTISELRTILKTHGGSMGEPGCVMWKFEMKAPGEHVLKYPQYTDEETRQKAEQLVEELEQHPDVDDVQTDVIRK